MSIPMSFFSIFVIVLLSGSITAVNAQPPIIRAPPVQPVIVDANNSPLCCPDQYSAEVNQRILIKATIPSLLQNQSFASIVQIRDIDGVTAMLSWVESKLGKDESVDFAHSWTPDKVGNYTVEIFLWKSTKDPVALSPEQFTTIAVTAPSNVKCDGNLVPDINYTNGINYPTHPVLLMQPNSMATVCVTYQILYNWEVYSNEPNVQGTFHSGLNIGRDDKFNVTTVPIYLDLTGTKAGSKFTVIYKIYAAPNSKGFYSHSVPRDYCESYPMAVGYAASQVKASDFPPSSFENSAPCPMLLYEVHSVRISGMNYTNIVLHHT